MTLLGRNFLNRFEDLRVKKKSEFCAVFVNWTQTIKMGNSANPIIPEDHSNFSVDHIQVIKTFGVNAGLTNLGELLEAENKVKKGTREEIGVEKFTRLKETPGQVEQELEIEQGL